MPIRTTAAAVESLASIGEIVPQDGASEVCLRAVKIVAPADLWRGLHALQREHDSEHLHTSREHKRFVQLAGVATKALRERATKLGAAVPYPERWEHGTSAGFGVQVVRIIEDAAERIDALLKRGSARRPGPAPKAYGEWFDVHRRLAEARFHSGALADLILASDADWSPAPCPMTVAFYRRPSIPAGRERLRKWIKALRGRIPPKRGRRVRHTIRVSIT
jgi:hypothetical protein